MLNPLLVSEGGNWKVSKDGFALERDVTFDTFADTKVSSFFSLPGACIGHLVCAYNFQRLGRVSDGPRSRLACCGNGMEKLLTSLHV